MYNKIIILLLSMLILIQGQQQFEKVFFNTLVDCSKGCSFNQASNWIGGVVPTSPNQIAIIDYSKSTSTNQQIITITSSLTVGGLNVTSVNVKVTVELETTLKIDTIILNGAGLFVTDPSNDISVNTLYINGDELDTQGSLFVFEDATFSLSKVVVNQYAYFGGDVSISVNSTITTIGNVNMDPSGTLSLDETSMLIVTNQNNPVLASFSGVNAVNGSTFTVQNVSHISISNSIINGQFELIDVANFNLNSSFIAEVDIFGGDLVDVSSKNSSINLITAAQVGNSVASVFTGKNSLDGFEPFNNTNVQIDVDISSYLLLTGSFPLGGPTSAAAIITRLNSVLVVENFDISLNLLQNLQNSPSTISLSNGQLFALGIFGDELDLILDQVTINSAISVGASLVNVTGNVKLNGSFLGRSNTAFNIQSSSLPSSPSDTIFVVEDFNSGQGKFTLSSGSFTFGLYPNSQGVIPSIIPSQPYYLISSSYPLNTKGTSLTFSTPSVTSLTPKFQFITQNSINYLIITFN